MKKSILSSLLILALTGLASAASGGKEITLTGKGCCAKCCLKTASECQNALTVEKDGKKTVYTIVQNEVSKAFHENICKKPADIVVTATCAKVGDHLELTPSKIELKK